jgi:hypothetical protein
VQGSRRGWRRRPPDNHPRRRWAHPQRRNWPYNEKRDDKNKKRASHPTYRPMSLTRYPSRGLARSSARFAERRYPFSRKEGRCQPWFVAIIPQPLSAAAIQKWMAAEWAAAGVKTQETAASGCIRFHAYPRLQLPKALRQERQAAHHPAPARKLPAPGRSAVPATAKARQVNRCLRSRNSRAEDQPQARDQADR